MAIVNTERQVSESVHANGTAALPIAAGRWSLDRAHSQLGFSVRHLAISNVRGRFASFDAELTVGNSTAGSRLFVMIDAASFSTGNEMRDGHVRSADFLDVEHHPRIIFESTSISEVSPGEWLVAGGLEMHGVRAPVTLVARLEGVADDPRGVKKAAFTVTAEIDRNTWGLSWDQPLAGGGLLIGRTVRIDIDVQLVASPEQPIIERVRALALRIRARASDLEVERTLPRWLVDELYDAGVFRALTPASLGGLEMHPIEWMNMVEELSRINGSVGWLAMINSGIGWASLQPDVAARLLAMHDRPIMAGNQTPGGKAIKVDGGYRVTGRWKFTSGCLHSQFLAGTCLVVENDQPVFGPDGPELRNALFLRSEVTIEDTWDGMGMRGTGSHDLIADDVFVPDERITRRDRVSSHHDGPLYKSIFMLMAHSAHALGIARAAIEAAIETEAKGFGALAQLMGREGAKMALAEAEAIVRANRCFVWDAIERAHAEAVDGDVSADTTVNLQLAMVHSVHEAARAVDLVYHQAGSRSVFTSNALSTCFRDIHTATQHIIIFKPNYKVLGEYLFTKDQPGGPVVSPGVFFAR